MKAIINRKTYNTQTAQEIAIWESGGSQSDFGWYKETLYRTKKGAWFIHGEGNADSPYCRRIGNEGYMGSQKIVPYSDAQALKWLEENHANAVVIIEAYFSDMVEEA